MAAAQKKPTADEPSETPPSKDEDQEEDAEAREKRLNEECMAEVAAAARESAAKAAEALLAASPISDFLNGLGLSQHVARFEEDEVDLPTLAMVQRRQGTAALHEALVELGVAARGHRMKIAAALAD